MLLRAFAAHRKPLVCALFALGLAAGLLEGAFVLVAKAALEDGLWRTWASPLLLLSAAVTLRTIAQIASARLEARGLSVWMAGTRRAMLEAAAGRALPAYRAPWRNNLVTSLGEWMEQSGAGTGAGLRCLASLAQAAMLAPLLLLFSWKLALGAMALAVPAFLAGRLKAGVLAAAGERRSETSAALAAGTEAFSDGLEDAAGNGRLPESAARLASAMDRHAGRTLSLETAKGVFPPALEWIFFMSLAALLLIAADAREAGPEGLLPFGALLLLMYRPIREWARHYPLYLLGGQAWRRLREFAESIESMPRRVPLQARGSGIAFAGVDFGYGGRAYEVPDVGARGGKMPGRAAPGGHGPDRLVFRGFDLRLDPRELTWIAGRNGAGKSTLLKLLAGVEFPSAGVISLPADWPERRRPFSYLPQRGHLDPDWEEWARAFGKENPGAWATLDGILGMSGILEKAGGRPGTGLSGGERQRLCLARAFASPSPYLLLDEPTTWLSASDRERILGDLLSYWREASPSGRPRGGALVSHEVFVGEFCSRTLDVRAVPAREGALG